MPGTVHIIGAGLAGLAAAVRLADARPARRRARGDAQAGGRCRSYHDPALGMAIDNGNHLLLSGNRAALGYLDAIGARDRLVGPDDARASRSSISPAASAGRCGSTMAGCRWWVFDADAPRAGHRALRDYLALAPLLWAPAGRDDRRRRSPARARSTSGWCEPLLLAALNIEPPEGSAALAGAVLRETLLRRRRRPAGR